jgi:hypothetical protein
MTLRVLIEIRADRPAVADMSWIDDLAKQDAEIKESRKLVKESRLHDAKVLAAKLPLFWTSLIERIEADCDQLTATFPDNGERCCNITRRGSDGFRIENQKSSLPRYAFVYTRNTDGSTIDFIELQLRELYQPEETIRRGQMYIEIDNKNVLSVSWESRRYDVPEKLAEAIIRRAIGEDTLRKR